MTTTVLTQTETRTDNRTYYVTRTTPEGRRFVTKRYWAQLSDAERAAQIEAETRTAYIAEFDIY